jgi:hypothetical protein
VSLQYLLLRRIETTTAVNKKFEVGMTFDNVVSTLAPACQCRCTPEEHGATQPPFGTRVLWHGCIFFSVQTDHIMLDQPETGTTVVPTSKATGSRYTSGRLPIQLVYCEEYVAFPTLYRNKSGWTRRKHEALVNGNPELLPMFAKDF